MVSNNGLFSADITGQGVFTTTTPVSLDEWTLITASYFFEFQKHIVMLHIGETHSFSELIPTTFLPTFGSSDTLQIGGPNSFKGSLYDFRIYTPGSGVIMNKGNN